MILIFVGGLGLVIFGANLYWLQLEKPVFQRDCLLAEEINQSDCLTVTEKDFFENYLRKNISNLSPEKEVLGGTFYVTKISWQKNREAWLEYEDGHIALRARAGLLPIYKDKQLISARILYFNILPINSAPLD